MESGTPGTPIKRRLTAILAADAVGYSRQMSENEERTLQVLAAQRAIIDRIIATHGGRIVGTAGDSVLAEFPSSVEAVRCAVEIQEGLETRNASLPEPERLLFRIGVNLGDVMVDGADILGDGVNVASRLEGIAEPGGICISSSVYDQIAGKLNLGFVDIGEKSLKNISRPIRVYRFDRSGEFLATPRRSPSRTLWIGAGAAAALAIAGVAIWRSGVVEPRMPPTLAPSTAASPGLESAPTPASVPRPAASAAPAATPQPEAASEETKLKLRIAEAERAKAEAELARSKADAEAAKQRARAERKETAAPLAAVAPASATSSASPPSARASNDPAATSASGVAPVAASPPGPSPSMAAAAPATPATAAPPSVSAGSPPPLASARGTAVRFCDAWEELKAFNDRIPARVADGEIVVERGEPGQPGFLRLTGRPTPDGHLSLFGSLMPTVERLKGREVLMRFEGTYANGQYKLSGHQGTRTCTMIVRLDAH